MKMKKLLALALAAVMAVSMLTACGGGGGGTGGGSKKAIDVDKINRIVSASVSDLTVKEAPEINKGLEAAKAFVATKNAADIEFNDVANLVRANTANIPSNYSSVYSGAPTDVNTKLAEEIIQYEAKSMNRIFYVGAIEATTKDGIQRLIYMVIAA